VSPGRARRAAARTILALLLAAAAAPVSAQTGDGVIVAVRVHGNHTTPDADVLALAGLTTGTPASEAALEAARARLAASGRFAHVEVRRRFASIADPDAVMVILMITEHPGIADDNLTPGVARRLRASGMWLPIVSYDDGYGFSYGVRLASVGALGPRTRVSAPLTWGGDRRAAIEIEQTFARGPLSRVLVDAGARRRVHPFDDIADTTVGAGGRAERAFAPWLRAGGELRASRVRFLDEEHSVGTYGADLVVDTRMDPAFPRNAVYGKAAIERLSLDDGRRAVRWTLDGRGFVGLPGAWVLAVGARASLADAPLPRYERALIGGAGTVRGLRAGSAVGDNLAALSAELRIPLTSPLRAGRFGVKAFADAGTVWGAGDTLSGRRFTRGAGGGIFFGVSALTVTIDVGRSGGRTRWHTGLGLTL
jgi:hypothetical protein